MCETNELDEIIPEAGRFVLTRSPNIDKVQNDTVAGSMESLREIRFLAGLIDPNICRVFGVCTTEHPHWTVLEYGDVGDLAQYLQFMTNRNRTANANEPPIRYREY